MLKSFLPVLTRSARLPLRPWTLPRRAFSSMPPMPPGFPGGPGGPGGPGHDTNPDRPRRPQTPEDIMEEHVRNMQELDAINDKKGTDDPNRTTSFYIYVFGGLALLTAFMFQKLNEFQEQTIKNKKQFGQRYTGKADIGGEWRLWRSDGSAFGSDELKGAYYIIYFGFCNCPDICPNAMQKLAKAYDFVNESKEKRLFDLKLVFVSVDPDRDTLPRIDKFVHHFHKDYIGVTGKTNEDPALREMMKRFKIYASKIEFETTNEKGETEQGYSYDHTVIAYLMSDRNEYLTHLGSSLGARDLAKEIVDRIMEDRDRHRFSWKNQQYDDARKAQAQMQRGGAMAPPTQGSRQ